VRESVGQETENLIPKGMFLEVICAHWMLFTIARLRMLFLACYFWGFFKHYGFYAYVIFRALGLGFVLSFLSAYPV
jgi:hypothetical protein